MGGQRSRIIDKRARAGQPVCGKNGCPQEMSKLRLGFKIFVDSKKLKLAYTTRTWEPPGFQWLSVPLPRWGRRMDVEGGWVEQSDTDGDLNQFCEFSRESLFSYS